MFKDDHSASENHATCVIPRRRSRLVAKPIVNLTGGTQSRDGQDNRDLQREDAVSCRRSETSLKPTDVVTGGISSEVTTRVLKPTDAMSPRRQTTGRMKSTAHQSGGTLSDDQDIRETQVISVIADRPTTIRPETTLLVSADPHSETTTSPAVKSKGKMLSSRRATISHEKPNGTLSRAELISDDHVNRETHGLAVIAGDDGAQNTRDNHSMLSPVVANLIQANRLHDRWVRAHVALVLQGKAICRWHTEGDKAKASKLFDDALKGKDIAPDLAIALAPFIEAIGHFVPRRTQVEKQMCALVKQLPIYPWAEAITGLGDLSLAKIVGSAGDIGNYRNPSCLWKRMGLAVIGGERQQRKTNAEFAEMHGYNPSRRALMFVVSDTMLKANKGRYREAYERRRKHTQVTHPDWWLDKDGKAKVNAKTGEPSSAHGMKDAMRYMVKQLLKDLWVEWKKASHMM